MFERSILLNNLFGFGLSLRMLVGEYRQKWVIRDLPELTAWGPGDHARSLKP